MDFIASKISSHVEAINSKAMSKIGDALVNLVFSLAQARYSYFSRNILDFKGTPKVSAKILKQAATIAKETHGVEIPVKGDAHAIADAVEALVAFGWVKKHIDIQECVDILDEQLREREPEKIAQWNKAYGMGFAMIIRLILDRC